MFSCKFCEFLKTYFLQNASERLLLKVDLLGSQLNIQVVSGEAKVDFEELLTSANFRELFCFLDSLKVLRVICYFVIKLFNHIQSVFHTGKDFNIIY